jgi:hypothetical protein
MVKLVKFINTYLIPLLVNIMDTKSLYAGIALSALSLVGCSRDNPLIYNGKIGDMQVKYAIGTDLLAPPYDYVEIKRNGKEMDCKLDLETHHIRTLGVFSGDIFIGRFSLPGLPSDSAAIAKVQKTIDSIVVEIPKIKMKEALDAVNP